MAEQPQYPSSNFYSQPPSTMPVLGQVPYTSSTPAVEPPLHLPWYGATFLGSFRRFWQKYATFSGRASRSEYWWSYLGLMLVLLATAVISLGVAIAVNHPAPIILLLVVYLASLIPVYSVMTRRFHDANLSGWWVFALFIANIVTTFIGNGSIAYIEYLDQTGNVDEVLMVLAIVGLAFVAVASMCLGILQLAFLLFPSDPRGARFDKVPQ